VCTAQVLLANMAGMPLGLPSSDFDGCLWDTNIQPHDAPQGGAP